MIGAAGTKAGDQITQQTDKEQRGEQNLIPTAATGEGRVES